MSKGQLRIAQETVLPPKHTHNKLFPRTTKRSASSREKEVKALNLTNLKKEAKPRDDIDNEIGTSIK